MGAFEDLTNRIFGKLKAIEYLGYLVRDGNSCEKPYYKCLCDCGNEHIVARTSLVSGNATSCGCSKKHYSLGIPGFRRTGKSRTPEYTAWIRMRRSCYDRDYKDWERYGGRGITVCDQWKDDFMAFLSYIGPRPSPKHSVDRYPDNDGSYEPGNVRWATQSEQARNRRSSKMITMGGVTKSMVEWAAEFGIPYAMMKSRVRLGWSLERIKSTPPLRQ